jgi:hypothetical protein
MQGNSSSSPLYVRPSPGINIEMQHVNIDRDLTMAAQLGLVLVYRLCRL